MRKKILALLFVSLMAMVPVPVSADEDLDGYTKLTVVDLNTFNEYRYRLTERFFALRNTFDVDRVIDTKIAADILDISKTGYNYLPDNLTNKNYYQLLKTAVERAIKYPNNESNYVELVKALSQYLDDVQIDKVKGRVDATPTEGNAPLTVTLRGRVTDPTGTQIPSYNYTWWIDVGGKRKIIGNKQSLSYTFREEGNYSVFLDVVSDHKNVKGYTDVLPFRSRADIQVKEKIASLIVKVNSDNLRQKNVLKFTPEEARYGLLFDATSSTPTQGSKFNKTTWDFGNTIKRENNGSPKLERVIYTKEGNFNVSLKLRTNENRTVERKFIISIHNPISTISASREEAFLGDKITFRADDNQDDDNLTYDWEIIDTTNDTIILKKSGTLFTYTFNKKGKFNVRLKVTEPSGEVDTDTQIIHINSRPPVADYQSSIPQANKPNTVLLDATKSYDPDFSDDGNLTYSWLINGERVDLQDANYNGSVGYYTFDSIGDQSVVLEVTDPDSISSQKSDKVRISSILSVDFAILPRVVNRQQTVQFQSIAPEATFYEWDFGDGQKEGGSDGNIQHKYDESGVFNVKLRVIDKDDNENTFSKNVYVSESNSPYALINMTNGGTNGSEINYSDIACDGQGAYVINKVKPVSLSAEESIDVTGKNTGLDYSWKVGKNTFYQSRNFSRKFDELGCFPVKLTVTSKKTGRSHSATTMVDVQNIEPTLSSLDVRIVDDTTDPVIVNVSAIGAKDEDGVIQSYLWYYYTDLDPEPQEFRATKIPSTTFVLPKIAGNYYFVVVMKDNNEARVISDEITGGKYFITLSGDNINTPLIQLGVDNSSVSLDEPIVYTARVENILAQDISKNAEYFWDFDGDGFYDLETKTNTTTYTFPVAGEFKSKLKVKYKGLSNTKTIGVNIANQLIPDFGAVSIGNKVIFANTSKGKYSSVKWTLPDGTTSSEESFTHTFSGSASSYVVDLEISDLKQVKTIQKKVIKNPRNILLSKRGGFVAHTLPTATSTGMVIDSPSEKIWIYLGESTGTQNSALSYAIDSDIEYDSDLNGGVDDDIDNKDHISYGDGSAYPLLLNKNRTQTVRLSVYEGQALIGSTDIDVLKTYIQEVEIDVNSLVFEGISESEKIKIEKLKQYVSELPKQHRLKALAYVQKLQGEWFDKRAKANVILEFEGYIAEIDVAESEEIIELLESIFVEGQEDQSEKSIAYNALKNLLPTDIVCSNESEVETPCYDELVSLLEAIRDSSDIEQNRAMGNQVLQAVEVNKTMNEKEKLDFRAITKSLVYGGLAYIPQEEVQEVIDESDNEASSGGITKILFSVLYYIFLICLVFGILVFAYWVYYKVTHKQGQDFQDFVTDKTGAKKENLDVLSDTQTETPVDPLSTPKKEEKTEAIDMFRKNDDTPQKTPSKKEEGDAPAWLQGAEKKSVESKNIAQKKETSDTPEKKQTPKTTKSSDVPSWLVGAEEANKKQTSSKQEKTEKTEKKVPEKTSEQKTDKKQTPKKTHLEDTKKTPAIPSDAQIADATKVSDADIPDWLKGSLDETKNDTEQTSKEAVSKKDASDKIPDWLKESFDETKADNTSTDDTSKKKPAQKTEQKTSEKTEQQSEKKPAEKPVEKPVEKTEKKIEKKVSETKATPKKTNTPKDTQAAKKEPVADTKKTPVTPQETVPKEKKSEAPKTEAPKSVKPKADTPKKQSPTEAKPKTDEVVENELWNDGMKVPDWLKLDDDSDTKKQS